MFGFSYSQDERVGISKIISVFQYLIFIHTRQRHNVMTFFPYQIELLLSVVGMSVHERRKKNIMTIE